MEEVSGPIIAIALILCAVFVPIAFISGLTGQFYRQFALTIAISTVISAFNSLTLSPALAAVLLRPHGAPKDAFTRMMDALFGWFFNAFDATFRVAARGYVHAVRRILRVKFVVLLLYVGLLGLTAYAFQQVPSGFIPGQDKQYLIGMLQLPDGASLDRTEQIVRQHHRHRAEDTRGRERGRIPGAVDQWVHELTERRRVLLRSRRFQAAAHSGAVGQTALALALNQQFGGIQDAFVAVFPSPPVDGLGAIGGFKLQLEDRAGLGCVQLYGDAQAVLMKAWQETPDSSASSPSYQTNVPQLFVDIDRAKAKTHGRDLDDVFDTLQVYLGSYYVNDFNRFGRPSR